MRPILICLQNKGNPPRGRTPTASDGMVVPFSFVCTSVLPMRTCCALYMLERAYTCWDMCFRFFMESYEGVGQPFSPRTLLHTHLPFSRGPTQGTYRRELTAERLYPRCFLHLLVLSWETQHRAVCMPPAPYALTACNDNCQGLSSETQLRYHERNFCPPGSF